MSLSIEQLMQPRYMVIADYPDSLNRIGDVLQFVKDTKENWYNLRSGRTVFIIPANYPAIFRPMPWYEGRKVEDLPTYVKVSDPNSLWELPKNCVRQAQWWFNDNNRLVCDLFHVLVNNIQLYRLLPATETEYLNYKNKQL